jgi:hypothetical protein
VEVFIFCSDWADSFLDLFLKIESFTFRFIALFKKLLKSYDYEKEDRALVKKTKFNTGIYGTKSVDIRKINVFSTEK